MGYDVVPLRGVLFQSFFLILAIAIEASFLHHLLKLTRKTSVEYSATINLMVNFLGWLIFFQSLDAMPPKIKAHLINYIFFSHFSAETIPWLVGAGSIAFILNFLFKIPFLFFLKQIRFYQPKDYDSTQKPAKPTLTATRRYRTEGSWAVAVLWAHTCSNSFILLILLVLNFTAGK